MLVFSKRKNGFKMTSPTTLFLNGSFNSLSYFNILWKTHNSAEVDYLNPRPEAGAAFFSIFSKFFAKNFMFTISLCHFPVMNFIKCQLLSLVSGILKDPGSYRLSAGIFRKQNFLNCLVWFVNNWMIVYREVAASGKNDDLFTIVLRVTRSVSMDK